MLKCYTQNNTTVNLTINYNITVIPLYQNVILVDDMNITRYNGIKMFYNYQYIYIILRCPGLFTSNTLKNRLKLRQK